MLQIEDIQERRKEIAELRHSEGVFRDIQAREKEREDYEQRWFWELLQNAKDAVSNDETVDIRIDISEKEVVFSHTGNPFHLDDILSLIIQGSSKVGVEGKTGRFGTGFLTTYLLSKEVGISGELNNNEGYFQFVLNRNGSDTQVFFDQQNQSNTDFENSIRETSYLQDDGPYQTRFVYSLDTKGQATSRVGIESFEKLIPFTQLFNDQIKSIKVSYYGETTVFAKEFDEEIEVVGHKVEKYILQIITDGVVSKRLNAYLVKSDSYKVCLLTIDDNDSNTEKIYRIDNNCPKLFFTFPLIGSEEFGIPLVIDSNQFDPKVERNGIYLKSDNADNDVSNNRNILSDALHNTSKLFVHLCVEKNIKGVCELFNYKLANNCPWADQDWLSSLKIKVLEAISDIPCIPSCNNSNIISLNEAYLTHINNRELTKPLFDAVKHITSYSLVCKEDLEIWVEIFENYSYLYNKDINHFKNVIGINTLIQLVEDSADLITLKRKLESIDCGNWLNDIYGIISEYFDSFPIDRAIILNQKNKLRKADGSSWDECNDEILNNISENLGLDFPEFLISELISRFYIIGVDNFSKSDALLRIKGKLNEFAIDYGDTDIQVANAVFLKWLISENEPEHIQDLKILSDEKVSEEGTISAHKFPDKPHLILAPKTVIAENFPFYSELLRAGDCLSEIYHSHLTNDDYQYLFEKELIYSSPLITKKESLSTRNIELLIRNSEDLDLIKDDEGKIKEEIVITYTDFAYLTTSDGHIYSRNTTSKSSFERLNFFLMEACLKDPFFDDPTEDVVLSDESLGITFNRLLWVYRAKSLQWINIKNADGDTEKKFYTEAPTSKNLAELVKTSDDMTQSIRGEKQQRFLSMLQVGVSDLIRNTLSSEELKVSWDKAITDMITSDLDPELIQEIFRDPGIKQEYENRLLSKELINRNQEIGALIEQLFNQYIELLNEQGVLVTCRREPFGSDYILTEESSDLVNNHEEREGFKINNWLIELKATGQDQASMTVLQGKTAIQQKDSYSLIVIPLDGTKPTIEYIKDNAKVISNIGYKIADLITDYEIVEQKKEELTSGKNGVSVNVEDSNVRFRINSSVWLDEQACTIEQFVIDNFAMTS